MLIILLINIIISLHKDANKSVHLLPVVPVVLNTTFSGYNHFAKILQPLGAQLFVPLFYCITPTTLLTINYLSL